jgi:CubicO group peptidase (beta-lactamase class C family)
MSLNRRIWPGAVVLGLVVALTGACGAPAGEGVNVASRKDPVQADAIRELVSQTMAEQHMKAAIVSVNVDGKDVLTEAFGESIEGVPASTAMSFRNGAVAFAYIGNLLMQFVDEGKVHLTDTLDRWMPELPDSDKVTLQMLANQTAGYPDFEQDADWRKAYYADPFHSWTYEERLKYIVDPAKRPFAPGANWSYSHSNFMILGEALSRIGKKPLATLLQDKVLKPLKLRNTIENETSDMPSPYLRSFSVERRGYFQVPANLPYYEEETSFNTQWGTPVGANQVTTIDDMVTTAIAIGTGKLLSSASYHAMADAKLIGFGKAETGVHPRVLHADRRLQLRSRRGPQRQPDQAESRSHRLLRGRVLPAVKEERHRRGQRRHAGVLRAPEPSVQPVEAPVPEDRRLPPTERRSPAAARELSRP